MKLTIHKRSTFFSVCLAALLFFSACADLKSIRKFADISADSAGYTSLSADYQSSIERQKRFQDKERHAKLDETIKNRKEQQPSIMALHKGVKEYMSALGALASDELISYDKSVDSLASEVKKAKLLDAVKTDAFASLIKIISKAATDLYRQGKLKKLIEEANDDFQTVVGAMIDLVEKDFTSSLENEIVAIDKYYKEIVTIATYAPPQQAAIELVKDKWLEKREEVNEKKRACSLYVKTLEKIGEGHQLLFDKKDNLSTKQVLDNMNRYSKELSDLKNQIENL